MAAQSETFVETWGLTATPAKRRIRVIPTLLRDGRGRLVKTVKFDKRTYIGDPINAVRIFNGKEVDELLLLDIDATKEGRSPDYAAIEEIVSEAFMPVGYGGGLRTMDEIGRVFDCGVEKVVLSSATADNLDLIEQASTRFGAQSVAVCLQVKRSMLGRYSVRFNSGSTGSGTTPEDFARAVVARGAGELIVYAIDRDGTYKGYDIELLKAVSSAVDVPVVACGGARDIDGFREAIVDGGCSAVAAGSLFVYRSAGQGVLISYPSQAELTRGLFDKVTPDAQHR
jgi:cyclase